HLTALQAHETRMGEIERNGETEYAIGAEELLREPRVRLRNDATSAQLAVQTPNPPGHQRSLQLYGQVAKAGGQKVFVAGPLQYDLASRRLSLGSKLTCPHGLIRRPST